jgi:hypothetical protein
MLRLMLDSNSQIAIPGESHFITSLWKERKRYRHTDGTVRTDDLVRAIVATPHFRLWGIPEESVWKRVAALPPRPKFANVIETAFLAYADENGKPRWGDKTPIYVQNLPVLARLFPLARFVHLIRDGRDVALSYLSVPWGPASIWQAARQWKRGVTAGRNSGRELGPAHYLELRFESLVADPRALLKQVCDFASIEFEEPMLEFHLNAGERLQAPPDGVQFHLSSTEPPAPGRRDWRTQMPADQIRAFEAVCGPLLTDLGYERGYPVVSKAIRAEGGIRVRAFDLWAAGSRAKKSALRRIR